MKAVFWLALICTGIFFIQIAVPGFTDLFLLDQQSYYQPWRFVSAIFLHADAIHLLYNLFALLLFGFILEKIIGTKAFLWIFFASGIFANLISVNFYPASLGASGAIYGIIGALTMITPFMTVWAFALPMPLFLAAIFWTIGDIIQTFVPSNVGTLAHLSGLGGGLILGWFFRKKKEPDMKKVKISDNLLEKWENVYMRK